jgi:hypothetical protein
MNTTLNTTDVTELIRDAVELRGYSADARKSGEARSITRLINQANEADREALHKIRQAQEILELMIAEITADQAS